MSSRSPSPPFASERGAAPTPRILPWPAGRRGGGTPEGHPVALPVEPPESRRTNGDKPRHPVEENESSGDRRVGSRKGASTAGPRAPQVRLPQGPLRLSAGDPRREEGRSRPGR